LVISCVTTKKPALSQAVKGAHFFAQPVFVPLIPGYQPGSVAARLAKNEKQGKFWGDAPKATKYKETFSHDL
jgi:hypothetical protein